ncbi:hypothetical protein [Akkermansia sp. aa_0143]
MAYPDGRVDLKGANPGFAFPDHQLAAPLSQGGVMKLLVDDAFPRA